MTKNENIEHQNAENQSVETEKIETEKIKKTEKLGFRNIILISVLVTNLLICFSSILFIYLFGSGTQNIAKYLIGSLCVTLILELALFYYLNKIKEKYSMLGILFQQYIERSHVTIEEFVYPKKNIANSFNKQFDLINQTAAAISEITQMMHRTSEQINDCKAITKSAEDRLTSGKSVMERLGEAIEVIKIAAVDMDKMFQVINEINIKSLVISDIVAKTELLAMNASIEAARAGDHGKGFSVVSEEVQVLAQTSGKSAKQIKDLLNQSSIKVTQIIRTMNERIKEGEIISKKALDVYSRTNEGVESLKEQIQIIYEGTEMQTGVMKTIEGSLTSITENIGLNNKLIADGNDSISKLIETNTQLLQFVEDIEKALLGIQGLKMFQKTKGSEVRRNLKSMGF
ncbi:methyl-accepting chemotaxis protein [Spirobacillus cienkowskii]|uniref:methyl-accepting chemotaxis protein n=1 Tax=Spirobacillus cienkowskii TaxID=495820 RepID=UPI0030D085F4